MLKVTSNKDKNDMNYERKHNARNGTLDIRTKHKSQAALMGVYYKEKQMERNRLEFQAEYHKKIH